MNPNPIKCPHCSCEDKDLVEQIGKNPIQGRTFYYCNNCSKQFTLTDKGEIK